MQIQKKNPQAEEENFGNKAYRRLRDIPGYTPEALNVTFFYIKIEDYMGKGKDAYIRCSKKQAYDYRNLQRNSEREEHSYNGHIGNHCENINKEVEDYEGEVTVIEYEDKESLSPEEYSYIEETKAKARTLAHDDIDYKIIDCLLNGITKDGEIAKVVNLSRSSVQERHSKLQKLFKIEMADYFEVLMELQSKRSSQYGNKKIN